MARLLFALSFPSKDGAPNDEETPADEIGHASATETKVGPNTTGVCLHPIIFPSSPPVARTIRITARQKEDPHARAHT
jgi:hypothetical protein